MSMDNRPLKVAVVGHTNTGKTSLMRTLLKDKNFGEVNSRPGTTRHVEGGAILVDGHPVIELYDTPGLEDSIHLRETLMDVQADSARGKLERFVAELPDDTPFDQEAKVVSQLLRDDLFFYVIDVREPVLGKYVDEIHILAMAAKPVIPVLNFIADSKAQLSGWQDHLASQGLHAVVNFDTVIFNFEDEKRLYQKIQALVPARHDTIDQLIADRERQWKESVASAREAIADLVIDIAAFRIRNTAASPPENDGEARYFKQIREREQKTVTLLLRLFNFSSDDVRAEDLPIEDGRWALDLFDRENLVLFGINAGGNAAKGAAIGFGIDAVTGGLTLGAATALGALAGVTWSAGRRFKRELASLVSGDHFICVDAATVKILYFRQRDLLHRLEHRGHAAANPLKVEGGAQTDIADNLEKWINRARQHPEWSTLNEEYVPEKSRQSLIQAIAETFQ